MLKKIRRTRKPASLALAVPLLLISAAEGRGALLGDTIKPFASVSETYDSNVFKVKDQAQLKALMGDDQMSDFINVTTVGSAFHYGMSSLESNLLLKHDFINYMHYSSQSAGRDEMGGDASIRLFDRVRIKVDGSYLKEPQPKSDYRSPGLNEMTTLQYGLLVGYDMKSGLSFDLAYRRIGVGYSLDEFKPNEYDLDRYTGTVSYKLSPEAKVYASYQRENRDYREAASIDGSLGKIDNVGDSIRVGIEKTISPRTAVSGYVGYLKRSHKDLPSRDFSGPIGKAEVRYAVTSKIGVVVNAERQLYEETYSDQVYSVNNSVGAGAVYQVTEKVKASIMDRVSWKDFQSVPGATGKARNDLTNEVSAGVEWTPRDRITVGLGYQYGSRSSSDSNYNFTSHAVTASVGYKF